MSHHYLDAARQGKNDWWRYALGIFLVLTGFAILGTVTLLLFANSYVRANASGLRGDDLQAKLMAFLLEDSSPASLFANLLPHICGLLTLLFVVVVIHQRSPLSLISPDRQIRWGRIAWGFGIWWMLMMGIDGINAAFEPATLRLSLQNINWSAWLSFLPVVLIFIPIQTTTEELFFRGYLIQGLGCLSRMPLVHYVVGGLLFALPHFFNPEMGRGQVWMALTYFVMGVFGVLITLRDNRLELALGEHAANNIYVSLISNSKDSALKTPALIIHDSPDPQASFWVVLVVMTLAYVLFFVWPKRHPVLKIQKETGE
jgi:uncharacterized protein